MKKIITFTKIFFISIGVIGILIVSLFGYRDIPLADLKAKYAPAPSSFKKIKGMDVHYRDEGNPLDSIPIVLLHGTGASLHTFDDWTAKLKHDYRVVRMDLPAYGLTGPFPDRNYSIDNYVDFLEHFLTARGIKKCILAGNSLGGSIAWNFTIKYPEMVDKLILIDAAGYPTQAKSIPLAFQIARVPVVNKLFTFLTPRFVAKASIENVYADKNKVTDKLIDRYFHLTLRAGNRQAFIDGLKRKIDTVAYHNIKSITRRTLVLWGEQDKLIPVEKAYQFHNDLPNDTLVILKDVGHVPMEESPTESLKAVMAFLKE